MEAVELNLELWPKQAEAIESEATEILFGGASEGGKSHLVRVLLILLCLEIEDLRCVLIRKKFDDILNNHLYGDTGFQALLRPLTERGLVHITQKGIRFHTTNSIIVFQHCQDERQFTSAQGVEWDVVAIDEATQLSERLIRIFRAWCRMTNDKRAKLPDRWKWKLPLLLYTANPVGTSLGYFRHNFVKARPWGSIESVEGFKRQFIKSLSKDNLSVDQEAHKQRLRGLNDPGLERALDEGDWDAPIGDFFSMWNEDRHVIPDFLPPDHWTRFRTYDWGGHDPSCCYWWAVSDGEQFERTVNVFDNGLLVRRNVRLWFPRGALICYREWYIAQPDDPAKGVSMRNAEIAQGILARSPAHCEAGIETLTDSYVFADHGHKDSKGRGYTIGDEFEENGVPLTLGKTSRVNGWSQMRGRLIGKQFQEDGPRIALLFVMESCKYLRDYIPALPRHPNEGKREDAAEDGEATHACDCARLACMAYEIVSDAPPADTMSKNIESDLPGLEFKPTVADMIQKAKSIRQRGNGARY